EPWPPDTERTELAAHEYVHLWQYALGGNACMVGVRWIAEGMAESFAYRALVADGLIPATNMDTFTKRQLTSATQQVTLRSLETTCPAAANPFSASYLSADRPHAAAGLYSIRALCTQSRAEQPA